MNIFFMIGSTTNMENEYVSQRQHELTKYSRHEPIFCFLRELKTKDLSSFEEILFYFGEIDETDKDHGHTVWWCTDLQKIPMIKKAFQILCPSGTFEVRDEGEDPVCFRWRFPEEKTKINPVIFNKIIFPDFCAVEKKNLDF